MSNRGKISLLLGGLIALATAIAHASCIFFGPECFEAQMAPPALIESAKSGTWIAPVSTLIVSSLFILCSLFALSGAGTIKKIPLTYLALLAIAVLCILRGLSTIPLSLVFPEMVSTFSLISGFIWLYLVFSWVIICVWFHALS
ncbi:hypothetical protein FKG94_27915 [Exilibacterium tricleocarpae]|uniref:DUF423 domain-containing protein n=1 Tax=Exilibacterium tricleocarpae TaxID=2591008 RepID=A0A545SLI3_9GAMM|nr:hypothetical protein [Exilibacterium tricleocarpae]TQV65835.1 hypothetical protein FKG94_27915 [Exilibacterium tricleocarpae]